MDSPPFRFAVAASAGPAPDRARWVQLSSGERVGGPQSEPLYVVRGDGQMVLWPVAEPRLAGEHGFAIYRRAPVPPPAPAHIFQFEATWLCRLAIVGFIGALPSAGWFFWHGRPWVAIGGLAASIAVLSATTVWCWPISHDNHGLLPSDRP